MLKEILLQKITNVLCSCMFNVRHSPTLRRRKSWQTFRHLSWAAQLIILLPHYGSRAAHGLLRSAKFTDAVSSLQKCTFCMKSLEPDNFNYFENKCYKSKPKWDTKVIMLTLKPHINANAHFVQHKPTLTHYPLVWSTEIPLPNSIRRNRVN